MTARERTSITPRELERLAQLHSDEGILTACIGISPQLAYERHQPEQKFKGAASRFSQTADERSLAVLERERHHVLDYLRGWAPHARALVIFSCEPARIWQTYTLDVVVPTFVRVDNTPYTAMLARLLDEYPRMAVVLLDGGDARIYFAEQGRERQQSELEDELPSRHDQGGWSQARYQRHVEYHHMRHLKEVTDQLHDLYYSGPFSRLVLVGVQQAVDEFKGYLPDPLARRVTGSFSVDFKTTNDDEVLERARQVAAEDERSAEMALVQEIAAKAAAGGQGVTGIDETLEALVAQRVQLLAVADGLAQEGSLCPRCDYLSARRFDRCPLCDTDAEQLPDVIEHATERALLDGAEVNVVFGAAREELLALGGIAALLRY